MDPQHLDFKGTIKALWALGRVPLALEVPTWTLLGCLLSSQMFALPIGTYGLPAFGFLRGFDWWTAIQCMLVTWGTNVSINYGNEYFDWDLDRPHQVASIERDLEAKRVLEAENRAKANVERGVQQQSVPEFVNAKKQMNQKIMGNTTRIIHDGTFPAWVALACSVAVELSLLGLILVSRSFDPSVSKSGAVQASSIRPGFGGTPFKGLAIYIGFVCTFLSHSYVGPPLRLHYNGWGELVSALFLCPIAFLFGFVGHYTATSGRPVALSDILPSSVPSPSGFHLDSQMWTLIGAFYFVEQARIIIMHIHDIETDIGGGKRTFVSRIGRRVAKHLYAIFNGAALFLYGIFGASVTGEPQSSGMFMRVAGVPVRDSARSTFGIIWLAGITVALAYTLPIIVITYKAILKEISDSEAGSDAPVKQESGKEGHGVVPVVSMSHCAMLVSLQQLVTPGVLIITSLIACASTVGAA